MNAQSSFSKNMFNDMQRDIAAKKKVKAEKPEKAKPREYQINVAARRVADAYIARKARG
jgi:hypothetical protein